MLKVSSEKVVADHKDLSATTMSIDDNQSIVSLAGKHSIYLINVDQPNDVVCSISRNSKHDVICSDFHPKQRIYYALGSNNNVEIYSFEHFKNKNSNYNYHSYNGGFKSTYDEFDGVSNENDNNATLILRAHTRFD